MQHTHQINMRLWLGSLGRDGDLASDHHPVGRRSGRSRKFVGIRWIPKRVYSGTESRQLWVLLLRRLLLKCLYLPVLFFPPNSNLSNELLRMLHIPQDCQVHKRESLIPRSHMHCALWKVCAIVGVPSFSSCLLMVKVRLTRSNQISQATPVCFPNTENVSRKKDFVCSINDHGAAPPPFSSNPRCNWTKFYIGERAEIDLSGIN